MARRFATWALVLVPLTGAVSTAAAQQPPPDEADPQMMTDEASIDDQAAREFFSAGRNLYDLGRFAEAAEQFRQAYELSHRAPLLYNLYLAHRDAGDLRRSADALRQYLQEMDEVPDRVNLEARLVGLEQRLASEEAGRAEAVRAAEEERRRQEEARAAEERRRQEEAAGPGPWPWIVAGVGGAALIGGAITGILALSQKSTLDAECVDRVCIESDETNDALSSMSTLALLTDVLLISGGVIAAAGIIWGLLTLPSDESESPVAVSGGCGPTGCIATVGVDL